MNNRRVTPTRKRPKLVEQDMDQIGAPWTQEQVDSLNGFQKSNLWHPFCGTRKPNGDQTDLIATSNGWIEELGGPIVQTWAHRFMADGTWEFDDGFANS